MSHEGCSSTLIVWLRRAITMRSMVENATMYGITAVRIVGTHVVEAMMGLIDTSRARWDLRPAPTRVTEVVDRLVEGDTVISLFADDEGHMQPNPEEKEKKQPENTKTHALADEKPGRSLKDLPRF